VAENSVVSKRYLKVVGEGVERLSGSTEFHSEGTAMKKARNVKLQASDSFEERRADTVYGGQNRTNPFTKIV